LRSSRHCWMYSARRAHWWCLRIQPTTVIRRAGVIPTSRGRGGLRSVHAYPLLIFGSLQAWGWAQLPNWCVPGQVRDAAHILRHHSPRSDRRQKISSARTISIAILAIGLRWAALRISVRQSSCSGLDGTGALRSTWPSTGCPNPRHGRIPASSLWVLIASGLLIVMSSWSTMTSRNWDRRSRRRTTSRWDLLATPHRACSRFRRPRHSRSSGCRSIGKCRHRKPILPAGMLARRCKEPRRPALRCSRHLGVASLTIYGSDDAKS